jgi:hypothetical protein
LITLFPNLFHSLHLPSHLQIQLRLANWRH